MGQSLSCFRPKTKRSIFEVDYIERTKSFEGQTIFPQLYKPASFIHNPLYKNKRDDDAFMDELRESEDLAKQMELKLQGNDRLAKNGDSGVICLTGSTSSKDDLSINLNTHTEPLRIKDFNAKIITEDSSNEEQETAMLPLRENEPDLVVIGEGVLTIQ